MLVEKLTDIDLIDYYRTTYADRDGYAQTCKRDKITNILNEWDYQKSKFLYQLFGEKFIVRKSVEITCCDDNLWERCDEINKKMGNPIGEFRTKLINILNSHSEFSSRVFDILDLIGTNAFLKNTVPDYFNKMTFSLPNRSKPFEIAPGMKVTKVLSAFAKAFDFEREYENLRILQSRVLNQKKMIGNLCLSIHPLDYMTMSDNDCNWDTCMSWMSEDGGEYSQGTVEMMNSPNVIVAYLESGKPMDIGDRKYWSNKKWRELFIVTPHLNVGIKGYPYHSDELQEAVQQFIKELAKKNCNIDYSQKYKYSGHKIIDFSDLYWSFYTTYMYNDFCTSDTNHIIYVASGIAFNDLDDSDRTYSGKSQCMWCGSMNKYDLIESRRICSNCDSSEKCHCCGAAIYRENVIWINEEPYCECCYDDCIITDDITSLLYNEEEVYKVYLSRYPEGDRDDGGCNRCDSRYIYVYDLDEVEKITNEELLEPKAYYRTYKYGNKYFGHYYLNLSDLNEFGKEVFDVDWLIRMNWFCDDEETSEE